MASEPKDKVSADDALAETMPPVAHAAASVPTLAPTNPDHWKRGPEIARGGQGRVVAVEDRRLGRQVAMKELLSNDPETVARFEREALITARLQHPAIIPIYEAGRWPGGESFLAMKRVVGEDLERVIAGRKTFADRLALLPNVLAVADALAYAHSRRVIHRDLKPRNILIGAFGETVVIDWGLAKDLSRDDAPTVSLPIGKKTGEKPAATVLGSIMGTPQYMPPEQAQGREVDERADVYSLGALLYHVLTGAPPYSGKTVDDVLSKVEAGPPIPIRTREPDVPMDLAAIVNRAMERDPDHRYPTAQPLAEDLRKFVAGQLVTVHQYTKWDLLGRWLSRHRGLVTATAIAIVLFAIGGSWFLVRQRRLERAAQEQRLLSVQGQLEAETARRKLQEVTGVVAKGLVLNLADMDLEPDEDGRFNSSVLLEGTDPTLTLDPQLQRRTEALLESTVAKFDAAAGTIVVLDVKSGAIRALANRRKAPSAGSEKFVGLTDSFEPGTLMAPFVVATALENGTITPDQRFESPASLPYGRHTIHTTRGYDPLTPMEVLKHSSATGLVNIASTVGRERLAAGIRQFGFGSKTGLPSSIVEPTGSIKPADKWAEIDLAAAAFGHGLTATALQVASAYAAIANGGTLYRPFLVKSIALAGQPLMTMGIEGHRVVSEGTASALRAMLLHLTDPDAPAAPIADACVTFGGKTATTQSINPDTGGYDDRVLASLAGFAPAENPTTAIVVVINQPSSERFAALVAAPLFLEVARAASSKCPAPSGASPN